MFKEKQTYFNNLNNFLNQDTLSISILFITRNKINNTYEVFRANLSEDIGEQLKGMYSNISKK